MREMQFKNLCDKDAVLIPKTMESYSSKILKNTKFVWLDDISDLPLIDVPHFFVANEFFDALPIHKFEVSLVLLKTMPIKNLIGKNLIFRKSMVVIMKFSLTSIRNHKNSNLLHLKRRQLLQIII